MAASKNFSDILYDLKTQYQLKPEQSEALQMIVAKQSVFCVLPTGYGKSYIFGLAPLMLDKVYII